MENNQVNVNLIKENISDIYEYLYLNSLDENMIKTLNLYMDAYHQTLNTYLSANNPSPELTQRLQILSGPINFVYANFPESNFSEPHPAAEIIKKKINDYGTELENNGAGLEKSFTKALKKQNIPSIEYEDYENIQTNGFTMGIIIILLTSILGIILGALLFFIK